MSRLLVAQRALTVPGWVKDALWRSAQAIPSLDLRFAENKSLTDAVTGASLVTFTRASSGTFVGSDGVLQTAAIDVPRFDHNPTTGESLGLLVEEQRTNLLLNSGTLSTQSVTVTAVAHTLSFTGTGTITLTGTSTAGPLVGTGTGEANRASLTFTPTAGSLTLTVSGTVTNAQLEAGAFRTSYIVTAGAQATRSADVASITGTAFSGWYNQSEGSFYSDSLILRSQIKTQVVWSAEGGTFSTSLRQPQSTANQFRALVNNVFTASTGANLTDGATKAAVAYSGAQGRLQVGTAGVDATGAGTSDAITLGIGNTGGTTQLNGHIRRLTYWPQALPSRLQALTQ